MLVLVIYFTACLDARFIWKDLKIMKINLLCPDKCKYLPETYGSDFKKLYEKYEEDPKNIIKSIPAQKGKKYLLRKSGQVLHIYVTKMRVILNLIKRFQELLKVQIFVQKLLNTLIQMNMRVAHLLQSDFRSLLFLLI